MTVLIITDVLRTVKHVIGSLRVGLTTLLVFKVWSNRGVAGRDHHTLTCSIVHITRVKLLILYAYVLLLLILLCMGAKCHLLMLVRLVLHPEVLNPGSFDVFILICLE